MAYDLVFAAICILLGYLIGRCHQISITPKNQLSEDSQDSFKTRQFKKVLFHSDAERIKELNALSAVESNLYRLLKNEFHEFDVIIKSKRFFIVDADRYPIAIFEYHSGRQGYKAASNEDGVPLFVYKARFSSAQLKEDALQIRSVHKKTA